MLPLKGGQGEAESLKQDADNMTYMEFSSTWGKTCLDWCACKCQRIVISRHYVGGIWSILNPISHGAGNALILTTTNGRAQVG